MSERLDPWGTGLEDAWRAFREQLTQRLECLEVGRVLMLQLPEAEEAEDGATPYVQFISDAQGAVLGEVSGNRWLLPAFRLDAGASALLVDIGWVAPADESDPDRTNFWCESPTSGHDWIALMAVRALCEVFGALHPAFLVTHGLTDDPDEADDEVDTEGAVAYATDHADLVRLVAQALAPLIGHDPEADDDGDFPISSGESVVWVRARNDGPVIDVWSVVVNGVTDHSRALAELNILNRHWGGYTYVLRGDAVLGRLRIAAEPFVAEQLRCALREVLETVDEIAGDLASRVGGHRYLAESPGAPAARDTRATSSRRCWHTVLQLEASCPGSVDPDLAAHIFGYDQQMLLDQIRRLERTTRTELVPLLREALRVAVQVDYVGGTA